MDLMARELIGIGDRLFSRQPIQLWQALAENFYPMRSDFTKLKFIDDEEITNHLMTAIPILYCRELSDTIAAMMRPRALQWAELHAVQDDIDENIDNRRWMEWASKGVFRAMYNPNTGFVRACKEADYDWVAFGQAVIYPSLNRNRDGLLYQNFHLRDCAWSEGENGRPNMMHRNWAPTISQLCKMFPSKVPQSVKDALQKEPNRTVKCRHIVLNREAYGYTKRAPGRGEFQSIMIDCEHDVILEEIRQQTFRYVVPRWKTVSSSPYGRAPVTEVLLPDARTFQALARIILEAGEKAVDPEMIAAEEVFRSDFDRRAGGVTWAELEFDQRLSDKYAVLDTDKSGMQAGFEIARIIRESLMDGFYLSKINLPPAGVQEMTAYETRKRIEEHVRRIAPLFEPVEEDYNSPLMDETFQLMWEGGAFGGSQNIPETLRGADAKFLFRSPLRDTEDESNAARLVEGLTVLQQVANIDPAQLAQIELTQAVRDTLVGIRWPSKWLAPLEAVEAQKMKLAQMQEMQQGLQVAEQAAGAGQKAGRGVESVSKAAGMIEQLTGGQGGQPLLPPPEGT